VGLTSEEICRVEIGSVSVVLEEVEDVAVVEDVEVDGEELGGLEEEAGVILHCSETGPRLVVSAVSTT
jgi:hypothetical protein